MLTPTARLAFDAIGTAWTITTPTAVDSGCTGRLAALVERYDRTWSRFRDDSAVRAISGGGSADLGPDAADLLPLLLDLADETRGAMTPLVGGSLERLGYGPGYRLVADGEPLPAPGIDALWTDGSRVTLERPAVIDVGSAGKGQLVDLVAHELTASGHGEHLVDGGRDLVAAGRPVRCALEHPYDPEAAIGVVVLEDAALCGSAVTRRAWPGVAGGLHHVLDGRTGAPVDSIAATWVLGSSALVADALSTALFFLDVDRIGPVAARHGGWAEGLVMTTDGRLLASAGFDAELFS